MRFACSLAVVAAIASVASAADPKTPAYPRRLLIVHAGDYLYLSPLTHAMPNGPDRVRDAADRLAGGLRVPAAKDNDQLFVLADSLLQPEGRVPTREAIQKTLDSFCATTRPQDRVVIYFGVHAIEKDGKAYLVPLDGEPGDIASLFPVADVYARLKELKAAQVVVIWDVCRINPERLGARRHPGPMTEPLFRLLTIPPEGVQVLVSCSPGEFAREYFTPRGPARLFAGSAYLDALRQAAEDDRTGGPKDAIPVEAWNHAATKLLAGANATDGFKQTPAFAGQSPKDPAAFDPHAKPAARFELPAGPKVNPAARLVFDELALPPLYPGSGPIPGTVAFPDAALKGYEADASVEAILRDPAKYPLRVAVIRALDTLRKTWPNGDTHLGLFTEVPGKITDAVKKPISRWQELLALAIIQLELELEKLEALADKRKDEPKRWQAHYDFLRAELRLRLVVLNEHNRVMGFVQTETLPELTPGAPGWRLAPSEKLQSRKDVKEQLDTAQKAFEQLAKDHPGTPWAVLARRSLAVQPGLRWEPIAPAPDEK